ncbi:MAG TPA: hypothetical protein VFS43_15315 [Polyangiaceae bacterium]|nr:hypothetical protein [Polyangiaceae bacterium]
MRSPDTHPGAHEAQLLAYRRMSPAQKAEIAVRLSVAVRELAAEGIRQRHPEYDERDVRKALVALLYGVDVARRLWPSGPVPAP